MKQSNPEIEKYRVRTGRLASDTSQGNNGAFVVTGPRRKLLVIVSDEGGWEYVSVSVKGKTECVIQYHPPLVDYINYHPGVLHLWRPVGGGLPMPPKAFV